MSKSSVMIALPQMIDLALNSPEVGAVNFNILHALLHVMVQQLDLIETKVEFRGSDSDRVQSFLATGRQGPILNLSQYSVTDKEIKKDKSGGTGKDVKDKATENDKRSKNDSGSQTVVVIEQISQKTQSPHLSIAIDKKKFDFLDNEVKNLRKEFTEFKEMPTNDALIDAIRNQGKESPVLEMFQLLNLSKRIEAVETGMGKVGSIIEHLAKETPISRPPEDRPDPDSEETVDFDGVEELKEHMGQLDEKITNLELNLQDLIEAIGKEDKSVGFEIGVQEKSVSQDTDGAEGVDAQTESDITPPIVKRTTKTRQTSISLKNYDEEIQTMNTNIQKLSEKVNSILRTDGNKMTETEEKLKTLDGLTNEIGTISGKIATFEKALSDTIEKIHIGVGTGGGGGGGGGGMDTQGALELYNKITSVQDACENQNKLIQQLSEDRQNKQIIIETLLEQVELLKALKANREDLEDALADKADSCAVNRKVSHDQFDAVCDDIKIGIDGMMIRIREQENVWEQAMSDIQKEVGSKLDKMDLNPLQEFVSKKIKMLQEKLKALSALKRETEAAGAKSKFLRDVNCISCDKDVVMRTEIDPTMFPTQKTLPPTKSMGPYLAYELDALRKQQKCGPNSRNMNHFEEALTPKAAKGDHLCNRYCGGSHTTVTAQQRVTRLGHFMQQYGIQNEIKEGYLMGIDGQLYKSKQGKTSSEILNKDFIPTNEKGSLIVQKETLNSKGSSKFTKTTGTELVQATIAESATKVETELTTTNIDKLSRNSRISGRSSALGKK